MKKGVIIALVVVLVLCALTACAGGAIYYFLVMKVTPQSAFTEAISHFTDGQYYQYTQEGAVTMEIPDYDVTMNLDMSEEGKVDIQNDSKYSMATETVDGETSTTETYVIGSRTYTSIDGSDFDMTTTEDTGDVIQSSLEALAMDQDYDILDDESVKGEDCYHYSVNLTEADKDDIASGFTELEDGYTYEDVTIGDINYEIWISKATQRVIRVTMTIEEISGTLYAEGEYAQVDMTDIELTAFFTDWDVPITIEQP